jgi:hypothetical protein
MIYVGLVVIFFFCRTVIFDDEGNLLEDVPADPVEVGLRKKVSDARNKFEDLIQRPKALMKEWIF